MSGNSQIGGTSNGADTDIAALMASNPQDVGGSDHYEVSDGGFADPEAGAEETASQLPAPVTPQEPAPVQPPAQETFLGSPPEATETELEPETDAVAEAEAEAEISHDDVIKGLTSGLQAERNNRQEIQKALVERDAALAEANAFRNQYEPHIDELSALWPEIQSQNAKLLEATRNQEATTKRLDLYRAAAREAGLDVGEEALAQQEMLENIARQQAELPNLIDQRVSRVIDTRSQKYADSDALQMQQQAAAKAVIERETATAAKLDSFYEANPSMKEFDTFIRREVQDDPTLDPSVAAAPFLKVLSRNAVKGRVKTKAAVQVAGVDTSQATAVAQEAAGSQNLGAEYANMSIDAQIAKLRRSGVLNG